jgi:hypothetical protein
LLEPTAAGGDSSNESGAASSVVFYQRTGDSLISVPGIDATTFSSVQSQPVFALGDIDANNQLNGISPLESVPEFVNTVRDANDDLGLTADDTILTVAADGMLCNDSDLDSTDNLTVTAFDAVSVAGAVVNVNADWPYTYDPTVVTAFTAIAVGESATDTFTYMIDNGSGGTDSATVSITINGANATPVAIDDSAIANEDTALIVGGNGVLANDGDTDTSDSLSVIAFDTLSASGASVTVDSDGSYIYDPTNAAAFGSFDEGDTTNDSFSYTMQDNNGATSKATVKIKIEGSNDGLTATANTYTIDEDTTIIGNLMDDGTPDRDPSFTAGSILATDESKLTLQFNVSNDTDGNDQ